MNYMMFHHIRLSLNGLYTMYTFGIIVALGCPSLLWRQLDPFKMIPDLSVSRPAKSFTFLCGRLMSIRHGRKTCGRPQTCRKHTLEANFYFRPNCLGGKTFAKTPLAEVVSPVPPALGHGWRNVSPDSPSSATSFAWRKCPGTFARHTAECNAGAIQISSQEQGKVKQEFAYIRHFPRV